MTVTIHIWPDDDWCYAEDLSDYQWKSDDYVILEIPIELEEEEYPTYDEAIEGNIERL